MILVEPTDYDDFVEYCELFYSNEKIENGDTKGIYPVASNKEIKRAIYEYLEELDGHEYREWGYGDSMDRERVREILEPDYTIV